MINSKKKGFTIVELVIVIAVIAVLAAVLIPTFSNLVKKANLSADQQAVRQMNTALALEGVLGNDDIFSVYDALTEMGMTAKDYKPLTKDTFFFWDQNKKVILHVDNNKTVIAPEQYKGETYDSSKDTWLSLSMEIIETKKPENFESTKIGSSLYELSVDTPEEFAFVIDSINKKINSGTKNINMTIDLSGKTLDMMGASITINGLSSNTGNETFTIKNGTIKNISSIDTSKYGDGKNEGSDGQYGTAGLINSINGYMNVVLEDLVVENINVKNTHVSNSGILVALNSGRLTIKDVTIKNSFIVAHRNVGALVGYNTKDLTVTNVEMENVSVHTVGGRSALLVGYQNGNGNIVSAANIKLTNCSFSLYKCEQNTGTSPEGNLLGLQSDGCVWSWCYDGKMKEDYNYDKYFVENALIMVPGDTSKGENKNIAGTQFDSAVTGWN